MANPSVTGSTMSMFPAGFRQIPHQPTRELNPPARGHPDRDPMRGSGMVRMAFQRVRMDPLRQRKPGPRISSAECKGNVKKKMGGKYNGAKTGSYVNFYEIFTRDNCIYQEQRIYSYARPVKGFRTLRK